MNGTPNDRDALNAASRPTSVSEAWALNKRNVQNQHTKAADLAEAARSMTDAELRQRIEAVRGNPKRPPYRRLNMAELLALDALMVEEARRG